MTVIAERPQLFPCGFLAHRRSCFGAIRQIQFNRSKIQMAGYVGLQDAYGASASAHSLAMDIRFGSFAAAFPSPGAVARLEQYCAHVGWSALDQ
jgi:hypothetical protein